MTNYGYIELFGIERWVHFFPYSFLFEYDGGLTGCFGVDHEYNIETITCFHAHGIDGIVVAYYFYTVRIGDCNKPLKAGSAEAWKHNREGGTKGEFFDFSVHGI